MKYITISVLALISYVQSEIIQYSTCPVLTDKCQNGYMSYSLNDSSAPSCWKKGGKWWSCGAKEGTSCKYDEIDISKCNKTKPPTPVCPQKNAICAPDFNITYSPTDSGAPPCWSKSGEFWKCVAKVDGKCNASTGNIDVTSCFAPEPTNPVCPEPTVTCLRGENYYFPNASNAPPCWKKAGLTWICSKKEKGSCDASQREIDVATCFEPEPHNPICPPKNAICAPYSNSTYTPEDPQGPPCWYQTDDFWQCRDKIDGKCNPTFNQIDVAICYTPRPPNTPVCPEPRNQCLSSIGFTQANFPNTPPCWKIFFGVWNCVSKVNGVCDASTGYSDVTTCLPPPGPLPCPQKTDTCAPAFNTIYTPTDPGAPPCWGQSGKYWYCREKTDGKCNELLFVRDLATCK